MQTPLAQARGRRLMYRTIFYTTVCIVKKYLAQLVGRVTFENLGLYTGLNFELTPRMIECGISIVVSTPRCVRGDPGSTPGSHSFVFNRSYSSAG